MIICGGNRVEWFVADYAAIFKSIVTIPVHVAFDDAAIKQILQETDGPLPIAPATRSPFLAVLAYPREGVQWCGGTCACHAFCGSLQPRWWCARQSTSTGSWSYERNVRLSRSSYKWTLRQPTCIW
jgi:hypothetical protein